jgi:hypothetical protein
MWNAKAAKIAKGRTHYGVAGRSRSDTKGKTTSTEPRAGQWHARRGRVVLEDQRRRRGHAARRRAAREEGAGTRFSTSMGAPEGS